MSRTKKGGKAGKVIWGRRANGVGTGWISSRVIKKITHKIERREAAKEIGAMIPGNNLRDNRFMTPVENGVVHQYFYAVHECVADTAYDSDCVCWHNEGEGPLPDARYDKREADFLLQWRVITERGSEGLT